MGDSLRNIANTIKDLDSILIFPHINMDGDSLGASTALCLALRSIGKKSYVMLDEEIPENLDFLECGCSIYDVDSYDRFDLSLQIDSSGMNRILGREAAWEKGKIKGCIDHHPTVKQNVDYDFYLTEPETAATGEIIYRLIKYLGAEITLDIANCIFAAIVTDTGNFQYSKTTRQTHEITAELYDIKDFNAKNVSALIYERRSKDSIMMEGEVLSNLEFFSEGKVAIGTLTQEILTKYGCMMNESEGIVQRIMTIEGVEVGCLIKEDDSNLVRVSLRAKHKANVAVVATKFGGGGHLRAAGCTMYISPQEAKKHLIPELIQAAETYV